MSRAFAFADVLLAVYDVIWALLVRLAIALAVVLVVVGLTGSYEAAPKSAPAPVAHVTDGGCEA